MKTTSAVKLTILWPVPALPDLKSKGAGEKWGMAAALALLLAAGLLIRCSAPLIYERAAVQEGLSFSGGLGISSGTEWFDLLPDTSWFNEGPGIAPYWCVGTIGNISLLYGISPRFAMTARISMGPGWLADRTTIKTAQRNFLVDAELGAKVAFNEANAIAFGFGWPSIAELAYLHDFGDRFTLRTGLGVRGPDVAGIIHFPVGGMEGHLALSALAPILGGGIPWIPSVTLGLGLGTATDRSATDD
jgi:hypothetical protein